MSEGNKFVVGGVDAGGVGAEEGTSLDKMYRARPISVCSRPCVYMITCWSFLICRTLARSS